MAAERDRLPFEPTKNRKKAADKATSEKIASEKNTPDKPTTGPTAKSQSSKPVVTKSSEQSKVNTKSQATAQRNSAAKSASIPQAVSQRMARRMAVFCGIPTTLGIAVFFACYWVVSHGWYKLPTAAVVFLSMGCFGLGVLGLSYGVLSASWEEETVGSLLGWTEFTTNFGRMTSAWRSAGQKD